MARPIEISDVISKVQVTERLQQNLKAAPEAAQQFQKELNERIADEQVTVPQPPQPEDQIILHNKDEEKDRQESRKHSESNGEQPEDEKSPKPDDDAPATHIDIRI